MEFDFKIMIDDEDRVLTFYNYPHVFWVDLIKSSIDSSPKIENNYFYKFLESIYSDYLSKGYCFIVDEEWEGHDINKILISEKYSYTLFDILDFFKKKYNINHVFFSIISSNLYYHFYKKSDYIIPYLHWLRTDNFIIDDDWWKLKNKKSIKHKFVYLNRIPKYERVLLYDEIIKSDLLKNCVWSWNAVNIEDYKGKKDNHVNKSLEGDFIDFADEETLLGEPIQPTIDSFCSILVESETDLESLFISEKTSKCFIHEIPFVILGSPNFLKTLQKLGFKTFDKWWDESYDSEYNLEIRIKKIVNTLSYINTKSIEELRIIYTEMKDVLHHNKKLYFDIHNCIKLKELTTKPPTFNKMHNILRVNGNLTDRFEVKSFNDII